MQSQFLHLRQSIVRIGSKSLHTCQRLAAAPISGYILLGMALIAGLSQIFFTFDAIHDEGDTNTTGWLMSQGWVLYKDIFSQHFPFSYMWSALIVDIFGVSFAALRISLLILRIAVMAGAMLASGYTFAIGLAALAWSLVGWMYAGNVLIQYSFSSIFIVAAFAVGLAIIEKRVPPSTARLLVTGLFCGFAVWAEPSMSLPVSLIMIFTLISNIIHPPILHNLKQAVRLATSLAAGLLISSLPFLVYHLVTHSFDLLIYYGLVFNLEVYNQYTTVFSLAKLVKQIFTGLDLFNPLWTNNITPFFQWTTTNLDHWLFSGFFFRLAAVGTSLVLVFRRKVLSGLAIYLLSALFLTRFIEGFHASPFVLMVLLVTSLFVTGDFAQVPQNKTQNSSLFSAPAILLGIVLAVLFGWLNLRAGYYLISHRQQLTYAHNLAGTQGVAGYINKIVCNQKDAALLVLPFSPEVYFFAKIPPPSKYTFILPWTAEEGQPETITALRNKPTLVYLDQQSNVWGYPVKTYLSDLIFFLDQNYIKIAENYYISPQLARTCPIQN